MKTCKDCIFDEDMEKLLVNGYTFWTSSESHPCWNCRRFPREVPKFPDNYRARIKPMNKGR